MCHVLQRLVQLKQHMHLHLEESLTEGERQSFDLTNVQWAMAKSVLSVFESVDTVTTLFSGEKYSTLSMSLPLLFGLRDASKVEDGDTLVVRGMKKRLVDQVNKQFDLDNV